MSELKVAVFGAGYVGLVTGACFADLGHRVVVRDIVPSKVAALQRGEVPIHEPGLDAVIARNTERLTFTLDVAEAVAGADVVYICVDTPPTVSGDADLSRVWSVIDALGDAVDLRAIVVKSTVPVGTGAKIRRAMDERGLSGVEYASNPEFTAEGRAVEDFMRPDRVVVGAWSPEAADLVERLHAGVDGPVLTMDVESAEMTKLAANAALMTRISFINEIANVCELTGADVTAVAEAVGLDHRIGPHFLQAGIGYGGSCFPKDSLALKQLASNSGYNFQLLNAVIEVNDLQRRRVIRTLGDRLGSFVGATVALLGMTFKAHTDDMREAPSVVLASRLLAEGAHVRAWDPMADPGDVAPWDQVTRCATPIEAMTGADAVVLVTPWPQVHEIRWDEAAAAMKGTLVIDGRNALDPAEVARHGLRYQGIGRRPVG